MLYPLSYGSWAGCNQPVGLHKLLMARTTRTHRRLQPQATIERHLRHRHGMSVNFKGNDAVVGRDLECFWALGPPEVAFDLMPPSRQFKRRRTLMLHHRTRAAIDRDLLRPLSGATRQREPSLVADFERNLELSPTRAQIKLQ